jgi:PKD repeat protein
MKLSKLLNLFWLSPLVLVMLFSGCSKDKGPSITAAFSTNSDSVQVYDTVYFTNESTNAKFYQWDFGDKGNSIVENPSHVYTTAGSYTVSLRAIGDNGSDSTASVINIIPFKGNVITEGVGIPEVSLGDTWSMVQTSLVPVQGDTLLFSNYITQYEVYSNLVYYTNEGIITGFASSSPVIKNTDKVYEIILLDPYVGTTTKGISLGSTLTQVKNSYGDPEKTDTSDPNFTGYLYPSLGSDFYTHNQADANAVAEIYIYTASNSARINVPKPQDVQKFRDHFLNR